MSQQSPFRFPPHPHVSMKIPHSEVVRYEAAGGWVAQRKFNGSRVVAHVCDGQVEFWNRQGKHFTTYRLTEGMIKAFTSLPGLDPAGAYLFDGELLHTKAKSRITAKQAATDTVVLFDVLKLNVPLVNYTFLSRYQMLADVCGNPSDLEPKRRALSVTSSNTSQIWLAEIFRDDFEYRFYENFQFDKQERDLFPEIEGLVLKKEKDSTIQFGLKPYDVYWMMRVRKPKAKVYDF